MTAATIMAALALAVWAYLILLHGGFWLAREREDAAAAPALDSRHEWPRVTAIIPARNEADMIPRSLASLIAQRYPGEFSIVLVDDQSSDGTADIARGLSQSTDREIVVVNGAMLPPAWTGKVWALHQGIAVASAAPRPPDYLLLTDADIAYQGDVLTALVAQTLKGKHALTSVMAKLNTKSFAERALIPAFIFFFQMLYPFAWVNRSDVKTAAAAGGCMLVDRRSLERSGGIEAIRGALIDDCWLAKLLKMQGPIWLGLSERVTSLRAYPSFETIRLMVARSAYAQLRYSPWLLIGTVLGMGFMYILPPVAACVAGYPANLLGAAAYLLMVIAFQPTLRFYNRSPLWGLALPLIAATYVGFTLDSAYQHSLGRGGLWKGRVQAEAGSNDARHKI
jgi:hopene-associated glycosyltransferase HpnB